MSEARHVMILASAGSGKTYRLTGRFIGLLARGAPPERIVALTFTRKAAGEFFDEILKRLAAAAGESAAADKLASEIGMPGLKRTDFLPMLRAVIDAMPRLRLGTMDGFFARIVRAFPLELGLAGDFEVLEDHAARTERRRVLARLFAGSPEGLGEDQRNFIEEFKRATFGTEEKRLSVRIDSFLDMHHQVFLDAPEGELWGNAARIWPRGSLWLGRKADPEPAIRELQAWVVRANLPENQRVRWESFLAALMAWAPGATVSKELGYVLKKALDGWDALEAGDSTLEFNRRRQDLDPPACEALASLARHVMRGEIERRLEVTKGLHAIVRGYEEAYHQEVRRTGKLTFADVQRLLQPVSLTEGEPRPGRLSIDYRLDGGIDHWLLDEFQDTSYGQWTILRNLIDEAVQDPEERRTFFCVGDVKQAIFTWRQGDPRLFGEILDHYTSAAPEAISQEHLTSSWRSGPPVIEMANAVFGAKQALEDLFPEAATRAWNSVWMPHESAKPENGGHAALLHADDKAGRWDVCARLLREIRPLDRGLTCAILVQKNDTAAELADVLRRETGQPAVAESDLLVCADNPVGSALLALAKAAAHPGDRLAWEHLLMTPLRHVLAERKMDDPSALSRGVLGQVHAQGFERTFESWLRQIEPHLDEGDAFSRERARQFAAAAGSFDQTGSRDPDEFIDFMERHTVRDAESEGVIRVMTIHKSKGLGFDLVLLPDLQGQNIARMREGLAVKRTSDREIDWVLDLPPKLFREHDVTLEAYELSQEAESCYEKIALLYVALTRAKRATYAIIEPVGKSRSENYARLLSDTLGSPAGPVRVGGLTLPGAWSAGNPDWHAGLSPRPSDGAISRGPVLLDAARIARAARLPARRPSAEESVPVAAAALFAAERTADFGTDVHRLLSQVKWLSAPELERFRGDWGSLGAAGAEALRCLEAAELAPVWELPRGSTPEVWRERAFEVVLDGTWVSGIVDRAVVVRDPRGRAVSASVFDFKTDQIGDSADLAAEAARHSGQMNLYRRAIAVLTGLSPGAVVCEVVFTRVCRRVALP